MLKLDKRQFFKREKAPRQSVLLSPAQGGCCACIFSWCASALRAPFWPEAGHSREKNFQQDCACSARAARGDGVGHFEMLTQSYLQLYRILHPNKRLANLPSPNKSKNQTDAKNEYNPNMPQRFCASKSETSSAMKLHALNPKPLIPKA